MDAHEVISRAVDRYNNQLSEEERQLRRQQQMHEHTTLLHQLATQAESYFAMNEQASATLRRGPLFRLTALPPVPAGKFVIGGIERDLYIKPIRSLKDSRLGSASPAEYEFQIISPGLDERDATSSQGDIVQIFRFYTEEQFSPAAMENLKVVEALLEGLMNNSLQAQPSAPTQHLGETANTIVSKSDFDV